MKRLVLRTALPALLAMVLFAGVVFAYILPAFDRVIMDQKRVLIRELTESAWNILARCEAEERAGRLTREQAQAQAVSQVRGLHYGQESKDYFWILDQTPRMIAHPWRPDLEGSDLGGITDPAGRHLFMEMVDVVRRQGAGYVAYQWQWKDDARRIVPKLSYVKGFAPWGWILGTGVYLDDVAAERAELTGRLQAVSLAILVTVSLLLLVLGRAGWQAERGRRRIAATLQASEEKHRSLVEAAGEAILMAIDGERPFANPSLLRLLGYDVATFAELGIDRIIASAGGAGDHRPWLDVAAGAAAPAACEVDLRRCDGTMVRANLSLSRVVVQGRAGFMAVATRAGRPREVSLVEAATEAELADANRRQAAMASLMLTHGTPAPEVGRLLTENAEAVVRRSLDIAGRELGPAPGPFSFLLMGSLGRGEVGLSADQDHALIHAEASGAAEYFLKLGERVSAVMAAAGYPLCHGGIMAGRPECCRTPQSWRDHFSHWIHTLETEDLLRAKIFFDFRGLDGDTGLASELRAHLLAEIARQPRFCHLLARSILKYEPPLSPFGSFVLESVDGRSPTFDVKGVMAQVVDIARLRALQHGLAATGTLDRLDALAAQGHLRSQTAADTREAFLFLHELRLRHQAAQVLALATPDNRLDPSTLPTDSQKALKRVLGHIKAMQAAIDHEFAGG